LEFPDETVVLFPFLKMDATTALAIYRAEKDKALRERRVSHVQLMAEAQEAFRKMLADAQLARKGGRPKGSTSAPGVAPSAAAKVSPTKMAKPSSAPVTKTAHKVTSASPRAAGKGKKLPKAQAVRVAAKSVPKRPVAKRTQAARPARAGARQRPLRGAVKKAPVRRKQAAALQRRNSRRKR
jgi:hypothetical protein